MEIAHIGSFEFLYVIEERTLGTPEIKGIGKLFIDVYSNEGDYIPHFHFYTKDKKIDGCIKIYTSEYFSHGRHTSVLNNSQLKQLNNWLKDDTENEGIITNWQRIAFAWRDMNSGNKYKPINKNKGLYDRLSQPDYTLTNKK